eukprot:15177103-Alexandrium_andersonii.AAC.1
MAGRCEGAVWKPQMPHRHHGAAPFGTLRPRVNLDLHRSCGGRERLHRRLEPHRGRQRSREHPRLPSRKHPSWGSWLAFAAAGAQRRRGRGGLASGPALASHGKGEGSTGGHRVNSLLPGALGAQPTSSSDGRGGAP